MVDYDFRILQYNEFENLTRDLLQAEFDIYIESLRMEKIVALTSVLELLKEVEQSFK